MTISIKLSYKAAFIIAMAQIAISSVYAAEEDGTSVTGGSEYAPSSAPASSAPDSLAEDQEAVFADMAATDAQPFIEWGFSSESKFVSNLYASDIETFKSHADPEPNKAITVLKLRKFPTLKGNKENQQFLNGLLLPSWIAGTSISFNETAGIISPFSNPMPKSKYHVMTPFSFESSDYPEKQIGLWDHEGKCIYVQPRSNVYKFLSIGVAIGLYNTLYPKPLSAGESLEEAAKKLTGLGQLALYRSNAVLLGIECMTLNTTATDGAGNPIIDPKTKAPKKQFNTAISYSFKDSSNNQFRLYFEGKTCSHIKPDGLNDDGTVPDDKKANSKFYDCKNGQLSYSVDGQDFVFEAARAPSNHDKVGLIVNLIMKNWGKDAKVLREAFLDAMREEFAYNPKMIEEYARATASISNLQATLAKYCGLGSYELGELIARIYCALNTGAEDEDEGGETKEADPAAPAAAPVTEPVAPESSPAAASTPGSFAVVDAPVIMEEEEIAKEAEKLGADEEEPVADPDAEEVDPEAVAEENLEESAYGEEAEEEEEATETEAEQEEPEQATNGQPKKEEEGSSAQA